MEGPSEVVEMSDEKDGKVVTEEVCRQGLWYSEEFRIKSSTVKRRIFTCHRKVTSILI